MYSSLIGGIDFSGAITVFIVLFVVVVTGGAPAAATESSSSSDVFFVIDTAVLSHVPTPTPTAGTTNKSSNNATATTPSASSTNSTDDVAVDVLPNGTISCTTPTKPCTNLSAVLIALDNFKLYPNERTMQVFLSQGTFTLNDNATATALKRRVVLTGSGTGVTILLLTSATQFTNGFEVEHLEFRLSSVSVSPATPFLRCASTTLSDVALSIAPTSVTSQFTIEAALDCNITRWMVRAEGALAVNCVPGSSLEASDVSRAASFTAMSARLFNNRIGGKSVSIFGGTAVSNSFVGVQSETLQSVVLINNTGVSNTSLATLRDPSCALQEKSSITTDNTVCGQNKIVLQGYCRCVDGFSCDAQSGECVPTSATSVVIPTTTSSQQSMWRATWGQGDYDDMSIELGDGIDFVWGEHNTTVILYTSFNAFTDCAFSGYTIVSGPRGVGETFRWVPSEAAVYYVSSEEFCHLGSKMIVTVHEHTVQRRECTVAGTPCLFPTVPKVSPVTTTPPFTFNKCVPRYLIDNTTKSSELACAQGTCASSCPGKSHSLRMRRYTRLSTTAPYSNIDIPFGQEIRFLTYRIAEPPRIGGRFDRTVRPHRTRRLFFTKKGSTCRRSTVITNELAAGTLPPFVPVQSLLLPVGTYDVALLSAPSNETTLDYMCNATIPVMKPMFTLTVSSSSATPTPSVCFEAHQLFALSPLWLVPTGYRAYNFDVLDFVNATTCWSNCSRTNACQFAMYSASKRTCSRYSYRVTLPTLQSSFAPENLENVLLVPKLCNGSTTMFDRTPRRTVFVHNLNGTDEGNCGEMSSPCKTIDFSVNGIGMPPMKAVVSSATHIETVRVYQSDVEITGLNSTFVIQPEESTDRSRPLYTVALYAPRVEISSLRLDISSASTPSQDVVVYIAENATNAEIEGVMIDRQRTTGTGYGVVVHSNSTTITDVVVGGTVTTSIDVRDGAHATEIVKCSISSRTWTGINLRPGSVGSILDEITFSTTVSTAVIVAGHRQTIRRNIFSTSQSVAIYVDNSSQDIALVDNTFSSGVTATYQFVTFGKVVNYVNSSVFVEPPQRCFFPRAPIAFNTTVVGQNCSEGMTRTQYGSCVCAAGLECMEAPVMTYCGAHNAQAVRPKITEWHHRYQAFESLSVNVGDALVFNVMPGGGVRLYTTLIDVRACNDLYTNLFTAPATSTSSTRFRYNMTALHPVAYFVEPTLSCRTAVKVAASTPTTVTALKNVTVSPAVCSYGTMTECETLWDEDHEYEDMFLPAGSRVAFPPSAFPVIEVTKAMYDTCRITSDAVQIAGLGQRTDYVYSSTMLASTTKYFVSSEAGCAKGRAKFTVSTNTNAPTPVTPAPPMPPDNATSIVQILAVSGIHFTTFIAGPETDALQTAFLDDMYDGYQRLYKTSSAALPFTRANMSIADAFPGSVILVWRITLMESVRAGVLDKAQGHVITNVSRLKNIYTTAVDPGADVAVDVVRSNVSSCGGLYMVATMSCPTLHKDVVEICSCFTNELTAIEASVACVEDRNGPNEGVVVAKEKYFDVRMKRSCAAAQLFNSTTSSSTGEHFSGGSKFLMMMWALLVMALLCG